MNQWRKDVVAWQCGSTLYLSVPFTWLLPKAEQLAKAHKGKVVAGGPAVKLVGAPWASETPDTCPFDVLAMHNPCATFTTRGCPRSCPFCAVPVLEGPFRELPDWKPTPLICDNNLLASRQKHFKRVIESLLPFPACDFNQGLDARLFSAWHADQIARLRRPLVRFSFDTLAMEKPLARALQLARTAGLKHFGVYVLLGFQDTPQEARYRLDWVRDQGIRPNPQRFQPLDARQKNAYVAPHWTPRELLRMTRYYSRQAWLEHIPYDDYQPENLPLFPPESFSD